MEGAGGANDTNATDGIPSIGEGGELSSQDMILIILVVGVFLFVTIGLYYWYRHENSSVNVMDTVGGQHYDDLSLPPECDTYDTDKEQCGDNTVKLQQLLMKRCVACVPIISYMQSEERTVQRMYHNSMIGKTTYRSFQEAVALVTEEYEAVKHEADEIDAGWSAHIWQQAMHLHQFLKDKKKREEEKVEAEKRRKAAAKRAREKEKQREKKAMNEEKAKEMDAILAEKAALELVKEEEMVNNEKNLGIKQRKGKGKGKKRWYVQFIHESEKDNFIISPNFIAATLTCASQSDFHFEIFTK